MADWDELRGALGEQYALLVAAFADLDPRSATDCAGWDVENLQTHVAITARGLARIAGSPVDGPATGGVAAWADATPGLAEVADSMAKAEVLALAPQAAAALQALGDADPAATVEQVTGRHTLHDAALFRLVEGVVHGLDAQLAPHPAALRIVTKELARALADKYPGRSVEVRIPPYTAVQCVEGPRHTRGTPPNVVETDAVSFLRLCAGRVAWADTVGDGRVRASGERSDLSGLFPLLG